MADPTAKCRGVAAMRWAGLLAAAAAVLLPYGLLILISCGSGWTFPALLPDRIDFAPWRHVRSGREGLLTAAVTSSGMSCAVGILGTAGGLAIGRMMRRSRHPVTRFLIYLPFVVSPVIVGVALYDLLVRLGWSGTIPGVLYAQLVFAVAFAAVFFSELWSPRAERLEALVRNFGGSGWDVWRHAVVPGMRGLIAICFLQTALFSWLDYGLVSLIGGGQVPSVTMKLFSALREANVNQAAQASLILLTPAWIGFLLAGLLYAKTQRPATAAGRTS